MKKLLVLAAVAAMAMGAKAEYSWTFEIQGAQTVYSFGRSSTIRGYEYQKNFWSNYYTEFFDPASYESLYEDGKTTWAGRYATIAEDYAEDKLSKMSPGVFADVGDSPFSLGYKGEYMVMAILDNDEIAPGAQYAVYYGLGEFTGEGVIPVDLQLIESGTLMTDGAAPAPEPTSGLLLLLGVAGLALKRRRV